MTCGPGGTGAVVFDLYVPSEVKLGYKHFPGEKLSVEADGTDDAGNIGIIAEEGEEKAWGVEYGVGYGVVYGGLISGYVGLSRIKATGKMEIIPERVEEERGVIRRIMSKVGEGTDYAEDFSSGDIDKDNADSASSSYMANTRHRYSSILSFHFDLVTAAGLAEALDEFKAGELNQYSAIVLGKIGAEVTYRAPGMGLCFPYRFVLVSGGRGIGGIKSEHNPLKIIKKVIDDTDGKDYFFYKKAYVAGDFNVEA